MHLSNEHKFQKQCMDCRSRTLCDDTDYRQMLLTYMNDRYCAKCPDQDFEVTLTVCNTALFHAMSNRCLTQFRLQNLVSHNIFAVVEAKCRLI